MRRRKLLTATGTIALAGCLSGESKTVGLGVVDILNGTRTPATIETRIEQSGRKLYEETRDLGAYDGIEIVEDWMGDPVEYRVTVSVADRNLTETFTTRDAEQFVADWGGQDCFGVYFEIESDRIGTSLGTEDPYSGEDYSNSST